MTDSEKLDLILNKMKDLDEKVDRLDEKVDRLDEKVDRLDEKVNSLDETVKGLKVEVKEIGQKVTKTEIIIENEIRVNIQRVAEGHLDLSRKLNECIKLSSDIKDRQEIQDIYINMHHSKLKAL